MSSSLLVVVIIVACAYINSTNKLTQFEFFLIEFNCTFIHIILEFSHSFSSISSFLDYILCHSFNFLLFYVIFQKCITSALYLFLLLYFSHFFYFIFCYNFNRFKLLLFSICISFQHIIYRHTTTLVYCMHLLPFLRFFVLC